MIVHCSQCGTNQEAPASHCQKCGAAFTATTQHGFNFAWIGTIVAIIALLALAYYWQSISK